ncbi:MAG: CoA transferase [Rubrivivax sp.]|nr:CoA transferase [Burkholderiales bacterium]MCW5633473.1 CoA transferase [Rubrivivax sp.]
MLEGIRVLDITRILAGPLACQTLGDYGAEVIKVERPGAGDDTRTMGGPYLRNAAGKEVGESTTFLGFNRNKRSITVDLARTEGQALIRELAAKSDVLVENYKLGTLTRYGLGQEELRRANPRLIYCSVTGFGQDGPYARRAGYDPIFQAMGGLMSVTGERDGRPGGGPMRVGLPIVDLMTGMHVVSAILAALYHRDRSTGVGQYIDAALLDVEIAMLAHLNLSYLVSGKVPQRWGNDNPTLVPYQVLKCQGGQIMVSVGNDYQWGKFCTVLGVPELTRDARFATNAGRLQHRDALVPLLEAALAREDAAHWSAALEDAGVGCGPINDVPAALADPHVRHRAMQIDVPHPLAGTMPMIRHPMRFSATPPQHCAPPLLGADTREVLMKLLGKTAAECDALAKEGVI